MTLAIMTEDISSKMFRHVLLIYCTNSFDKMYSDIKHITRKSKERQAFIIFKLKSANTAFDDETIQESFRGSTKPCLILHFAFQQHKRVQMDS